MKSRVLAAAFLVCGAANAFAQNPTPGISLQYTSPAGVKYYSQVDTGPLARAKRAVNSTPANVDSLIALGLAQAGTRQYREAIVTFSKAMAVQPRNAILYRWRGHRYLSIHQIDSAYNDLTRGSQMDSTIYGIWYHLGIVRYLRTDFAGAVDAFTKALPLAPDDNEHAASVDWLWTSNMRSGRPEAAQAALKLLGDSLKITSGAGYMQRMKLYRGLIGPEQVFTPADTADVQIATLGYGLGNWYLLKGDTTHARQNFERAIAGGGFPAFGFIAAEAELKRLAAHK
jgi:tetratricopeptide (TPR) repeat protein